MNDQQLIDYCDKHCKTAKALFAAWRVNRMIDLAGNPRGFKKLLGHQFEIMRDEMQTLVDLARKRMARPATGLPIKTGKAYRDVNGEIRQVFDMPPRGKSFHVLWRSASGEGQSHLKDFQEWALEEVQA